MINRSLSWLFDCNPIVATPPLGSWSVLYDQSRFTIPQSDNKKNIFYFSNRFFGEIRQHFSLNLVWFDGALPDRILVYPRQGVLLKKGGLDFLHMPLSGNIRRIPPYSQALSVPIFSYGSYMPTIRAEKCALCISPFFQPSNPLPLGRGAEAKLCLKRRTKRFVLVLEECANPYQGPFPLKMFKVHNFQ